MTKKGGVKGRGGCKESGRGPSVMDAYRSASLDWKVLGGQGGIAREKILRAGRQENRKRLKSLAGRRNRGSSKIG